MAATASPGILLRAEAELTCTSGERRAAFLRTDRGLTLSVSGDHALETVELPRSVATLLPEIPDDMAVGSAPVAALRNDAEQTMQQAADYPNVSRPFPVGVPYLRPTVCSGRGPAR